MPAFPADETIWPQVQLHPWKFRRRIEAVRLVLIHASRGPAALELQYEATKNWQLSPANRFESGGETWAAISSRIIGHDGRHCLVIPDDWFPAYSAGHMDPLAVSFELAQPDDATAFAAATLERAALETARLCRRYAIPPRVLDWVSADNHEAPGIARHDRSDNGRRWGKSDPGRWFEDRWFEGRVRYYMNIEDDLANCRLAAGLRELAAGLRDSVIADLLAGRLAVRWASGDDRRRLLLRDGTPLVLLD